MNIAGVTGKILPDLKILIVSPRGFKRACKKMWAQKECEYINHWDIMPVFKDWKGYKDNVSVGFTDGVKSCSAGVVSNKSQKTNCLWHLQDKRDNMENLSVFKEHLQGDNAVLVGSKEEFEISSQFFNDIHSDLSKKNIPTTIMQGQNNDWETNLAYSSEKNALLLCVNEIGNDKHFVHSMKNLKCIFSNVNISPNHKVEFPNRLREFFITKNITK